MMLGKGPELGGVAAKTVADRAGRVGGTELKKAGGFAQLTGVAVGAHHVAALRAAPV
ncbi:hypothetical protein [Micromonospora sp. CPCC 206061]|uniref:hypothetical protein n=1 Tax=Micromonospora sp. CPCC 206061 TaxID=3122410 RepID=UPI002FF2C97F